MAAGLLTYRATLSGIGTRRRPVAVWSGDGVVTEAFSVKHGMPLFRPDSWMPVMACQRDGRAASDGPPSRKAAGRQASCSGSQLTSSPSCRAAFSPASIAIPGWGWDYLLSMLQAPSLAVAALRRAVQAALSSVKVSRR
jgi:hypothetical protein